MDADVLRDLYVDQFLSHREIARRLDVKQHEVLWSLGAAGIPLRDRSSSAKRPLTEKQLAARRANMKKARAAITKTTHERQRETMKGRVPPNKGKPWSGTTRAKHAYRVTDEYRERQSLRQRGEKSHLWRGGLSTDEQRRMQNWEWKRRRSECYERDGWTCQDCGVHCTSIPGPTRIQAHHVIPRRSGGSDELENLITLCTSCHHKREHRYRRALFA